MSIIEVLLAIAILTVSLAGAYTMVVMCKRMLLSARDHYVATTLCLARVERARDIAYPLLGLLEEVAPGTVMDQDGAPDANGNYRRTTLIQANTPEEGVTRLEVTVVMRNRRTLQFNVHDQERMTCAYTTYLTTQDIQ